MNKKKSLVSICCITYNHENYIRETIESFLKQKTNFQFEVLIYDDASTDRTQDIIKEFEEKYPDIIKPFYQTENQYCKGIDTIIYNFQRAKSKYIAMCEGDDYWNDSYKLQKQVDFLEKNDDYVITYHNAKIINKDGQEIAPSKLSDSHKRDFSQDELLKGRWVLTLTMCFRNVTKDYPTYLFGDTSLVSFLGNYGKGKYLNSVEDAVYRVHPTSVWSSKDEEHKKIIGASVFAKLNKYYDEVGKEIYKQYFKDRFNEKLREVLKIIISNSSPIIPEKFVKVVEENSLIIDSNNKDILQQISTEVIKIDQQNFSTGDAILFSIIMPNYNNEKYIAEAIDSILDQTYRNWEVIFIDDNSTDNSVAVLSKYLNDKRIKLIELKENYGVGYAKKIGIENSKGSIFGTMGADDVLEPNALDRIINVHSEQPECGLIYTQFVYCDEHLNKQRVGFSKKLSKNSTNLDQDAVSSFKTFKRDHYNLTTGYDPSFPFAVDKDIAYKMEEVSKLYFLDEPLYLYRVLNSSVSHRKGNFEKRGEIVSNIKKSAIFRRNKKSNKINKIAIEYFSEATTNLNQSDFISAEINIKKYQKVIDYNVFPYHNNCNVKNPTVSIVIVAYNTNKLLIDSIQSVLRNNEKKHEIIIVDNGENDSVLSELLALPIIYIRCPINLILSEGRNIGVHFAKGEIVAFLDDDALVPENYVSSIMEAFNTYDIVGLRGKVLPKTRNENNKLAAHYDFGEVPFPSFVNTEGNSAFLRKEYLEVGGMNPLLFGWEGTELSYRLAKLHSEFSTIYWGKTIIYHDFANTDDKLETKTARHNLMHSFLIHLHTNISEYLQKVNCYSISEASKKEGEHKIKRLLDINAEQLNSIVMFWYQNDWGLYGRRNEMLAKSFSENPNINKVLHIEPPINLDEFENRSENSLDANVETNKKRFKKFIESKVITYTPTYRGELTEEKLNKIFIDIKDLINNEEIKNYIMWLYPPHYMATYAIRNLASSSSFIVSDVVDDHRVYANDKKTFNFVHNSYSQILSNSNLCLSVSEKLRDEFKNINSNFIHLPNAVSKNLLNYNSNVKPKELENIKSPIVGYTGALSFRLDTKLIDEITSKNQKVNFVFVGTSPSKELQSIGEKENVHILPPVKNERVKEFVSAFDICIIPHEVSDTTSSMNPLKLYEYLALGKPVITTNVSGVNEFKKQITIVKSSDDFTIKIKKIIGEENKVSEKIRESIAKHTWERRTNFIIKTISKNMKMKNQINEEVNNGYYAHSRPEVQRMVNTNSKRILDVGCGNGEMASEIKANLNAEVWGIEYVEDAAKRASQKLDRVLTGTVEENLEKIPDGYFDTIIFADVLEHLTFPEKVLEKIKIKLKPDGEIVASIPNVRHWSVLLDLVQGHWNYSDAGLLDNTHFKFFTRNSIARMFKGLGLDNLQIGAVSIPPANLAHKNVWEKFVHSVQGIGLDTESLASEGEHYQYLVKAKSKLELVSIVVPNYNQLKYTKQFVESVYTNSNNPFELIIVDNGSDKETAEYLKELEKKDEVKIIFNKINQGFPIAVNQGIAIANGQYILIANNDIVVTKNWLGSLLKAINKDESIGLAGPISNAVSGLQIDKDAKYSTMDEMHKYAEQISIKNKNQTLEFPRLAFLCTLIKKEVIEKIGGLDERFSPGNFEDDDFCLRSQLSGYKAVIARDIFIHHYGSVSFKANGENEYAKRLKTNEKIFINKWGSNLEDIWLKGDKVNERKLECPINADLFNQSIARAFVNIDDEEYDFAIENLKLALEYFDNSKRIGYENITREEILNLAGTLLLSKNELEEAKEYFELELNSNPNSSTACFGLGEVFYQADMMDDSKSMFEWAIINDSDNKDAQLRLQEVNSKLDLPDEHNSILLEADEEIK